MNAVHASVLLVGNGASRDPVRALLSQLGVIQLDEAKDGYSALARHRTNAYDLIVCEWDLPHLSGAELLRAIRKGMTRPQISFVLLTGEKLGVRTVEALQAGANGVLEQPLELARTKDKLERLISSIRDHSGRSARATDLWSPRA